MLNARLLTFSVLLPCFFWLIFFSKSDLFFFITNVIIFFALLEWLQLLKIFKIKSVILKIILNIILFTIYLIGVFISWHLITNRLFDYVYLIMKIATNCWLLIFCYILGILFSCKIKALINNLINNTNHNHPNYHYINKYNNIDNFFNIINKFLAYGYFLYGIFAGCLAINYLKVNNKYLLLLSSLVIIATDVGGYVFGKKFGKNKLIILSPKKTWEGLLGGYIVCLIVCFSYYFLFITQQKNNTKMLLILILLSTATCIFAVVGDLFESLLKRIAKVKDSGHILPGHGGVLDRIDSFCSSMPIFLLIARWFEL
jgi:phosphatidate cytidylyltransferase